MTRLSALLLATTLLSGSAALPALAQQAAPAVPAAAPAGTPPAAPMPPAPAAQAGSAPDAMQAEATRDEDHKAEADRARSEAADTHAMFEAHLAALHAGLALTPEQEPLWAPVETAIRGFDGMTSKVRDRRADMRQDQTDNDPIARLKLVAENQLEHATALKAIADSADPLFTALDPAQKHRLPMLLEGLVPERGPLARMVDELSHERQADARPDGAMHHRWDEERDRPRGRGPGGWGWHDDREGMDRRHDDRRAMMDEPDRRGGWRGGWEHGPNREPQGEDDRED